ncbi:DEAD/DEAH box helicase [Salinisphaera sp. G21_0]|uniref:DEAD/DEAH box helicase n=1 Tax=Salinisphaera sp. G21_0 TaxID=2821094 RepID=UPI001ADA8F16|nr:DEAD/DEAH box helicase [Salinisphaera sp. G21_0]MBO9480015.1 DEAD/DEAH box helicase [Salinisphaera sp. G21_0]
MSNNLPFSALGLDELLIQAVNEAGYQNPTPIQAKAIPMALTGRDLMASAQTGTGKTASFTLPILHRLAQMRASKAIRALVLVPTRELAIQVDNSFQTYGKHTAIKTAAVYGGVDIDDQLQVLKAGVDVLVATPGRLVDMINRKHIQLDSLRILVLDEADRMLDLGFRDDIQRIVQNAPTKRQNLLFSATFSKDIKQLAHDFMRHPVKIELENPNSAANTVSQSFYPVDQQDKPEILSYLIHGGRWQKVLVFVRTKKAANKVAELLAEDGINAQAIHSDKSQYLRIRTLEDFKDNYFDVLVATDVAARGLDIEQLPLVINYDLPKVPQDYVHRIGRTGRAGQKGRAISLVNPEEKKLLAGIQQLIKKPLEIEPLPYFEDGEVRPAEIEEPVSKTRNKRKPDLKTGKPAIKQRSGNKSRNGSTRKPSGTAPKKRPAVFSGKKRKS